LCDPDEDVDGEPKPAANGNFVIPSPILPSSSEEEDDKRRRRRKLEGE
jgi:hypothetical protein